MGVTGRRRGLGLVLLIALVAPLDAAARRPKPVACPPGRFLVTTGGPLVTGAATVGIDALAIDGQRIGIDSGCSLAAGKVKASRKGTIVRAKWSACGSLKRVRLKGVIASPTCTTM